MTLHGVVLHVDVPYVMVMLVPPAQGAQHFEVSLATPLLSLTLVPVHVFVQSIFPVVEESEVYVAVGVPAFPSAAAAVNAQSG